MTPAGKIADLQLLRAVAVALVLTHHLPMTHELASRLGVGVWHPGWLGVDLFFVVSGYVITRSLVRDRWEPVSFVVRRLFRLAPPLLLLVALTAGLSLAGVADGAWVPPPEEVGWRATGAVGGVYTLCRPATGGSFLAVVWSLAVEDQFYAAVTLACVAGTVVGGRATPRLLFGLAVVVYLTVLVQRLELVEARSLPRYLFEWRFDLLAVGVLTGLADLWFRDRIGRWVARPGSYLAPLLLVSPLAVAAVSGPPVERSWLIHGVTLTLAGGCFAGLVLIAAHEAAWPWRRGRACRLATAVGDRSYALYLFHTPAVLLGELTGGGTLVALPVLVAAAELIYRFVEHPLTAVGRRLAERVRVRPVGHASACRPAGDHIRAERGAVTQGGRRHAEACPADPRPPRQPRRNHRMSDQPGSKLSPLAAAVGSS